MAVGASTLLRLSFSKVTRKKGVILWDLYPGYPLASRNHERTGLWESWKQFPEGSVSSSVSLPFIRYYLVLNIKMEWDIFQLVFYAVQNTFLVQELKKKKLKSYFGVGGKTRSLVFLDIKWLIQSNILVNCVNERRTYGLNFPWNTYALKTCREKCLAKPIWGFAKWETF